MGDKSYLGDFELVVMLAVLRVGDGAYTVAIRKFVEQHTGRRSTRGAVYVTLRRLEEKGYLTSEFGEPTAERGGRPKRFYTITESGRAAVRDCRDMLSRMWRGLGPALESPTAE